jgi:excisionase family DNA binding protein
VNTCRRSPDAPGEVSPRAREGGAHQRSEGTAYSRKKHRGVKSKRSELPSKTEYALPTKLQGGHDLKKSIYTSYDELPLLLNVKQLVDLMGVSDSSVYELIQEDDFPSLRIGKRIVVPKEELRKWITAHTKGASGC